MGKFKKGEKPKNFIDITGVRFGDWLVIRLFGKCERSKALLWLCVNNDGVESVKKRQNLLLHKDKKGKVHETHWERGKAKEEGKTRYFNGKACPKGHISERMTVNGRCVQCMKDYKLKPENVKKELNRLKKDREQNKKKYLEKEALRRSIPRNKIDASVRVRMTGCMKKKYRSKSFDKIFGYSIDVLRLHLERQFSKGMTWENHGKWHIDHIRPLSQFKYDNFTDEDFKMCWSLSNLRPLWAEENLKKSSTRTHLI